MTELMNFAQSVAREAGELILCEREQADLVHNYKGGNELVTNADIKADQLIRTRIEQRFAEHRLLSEESSPECSGSGSLRCRFGLLTRSTVP